ncbi:MAG: anti-sigma factor, partial [Casimicrobiaceae bacterium]
MSKSITDADIHAYADRQLAPERVAEFEDAMARDPAIAAKLADIERQNAWLRGALAPLLDEPLPQ